MKAVAYYRRSTNIQENSIEMQRQMARNASYQKALLIDEEFIDDAVSGRKKTIQEREGLSSMLSKIESGEITDVFVYKRDRLARNALDYLQIFQLLKEKQVKVHFTAENEIPIQYSPAGELIELLMAGIIQREGEQIVERISETIKANFQRGKNPGNLPFGYEFDKLTKTISRDVEKLSVVKSIFDAVNSNDFKTMRQLTDYLKDNNIQRDEKPWSSQMARNVLSNPTYMGIRLLNLSGEVLKSRYDALAIVTESEWLTAQEALEVLTSKRKPVEKEKVTFHLENLVFCKQCNEPLQPKKGMKNKESIHYYSCRTHQIKLIKSELENQVLDSCKQFFQELLKTHLPDFHQRRRNEMSKTLENQIDEMEQNLHKLNQRLERKIEKWLNENRQFKKEKLEADLLNLLQQIADEKERIHFIEKEMIELTQTIEFPSDNLDIHESTMRVYFRDIISKIEVEEHMMNIEFKHPFLSTKEVLHTRVS
ncbi:recombinase family protein [Bacillus salitolerans]|uniref:Recombinase family protein n=1 Tax=Bacillus salitolerans TaxID=1437434 RepID=A0ABW4LTB5_9BACI